MMKAKHELWPVFQAYSAHSTWPHLVVLKGTAARQQAPSKAAFFFQFQEKSIQLVSIPVFGALCFASHMLQTNIELSCDIQPLSSGLPWKSML